MKSKALLLVAVLFQLTCHQTLLLAPEGSSMDCFPNPDSIPAERGVSVVSCHILDGTGNPVPDGTVVQFFTTLGRIQEQGRTNDGVARVNFESTGRSGQAAITAFSGGESTGGGGGSSTTVPTTTLPVQRGFGASDGRVTTALSGIAVSDSFPIFIGNANAADIFLAADPPRITENRPAHDHGDVTDDVRQPGPRRAGLLLRLDGQRPGDGHRDPHPGGAAPTESLDSQGQPVFTETNGQARDTLRTRCRAKPRRARSGHGQRSRRTACRTPSRSASTDARCRPGRRDLRPVRGRGRGRRSPCSQRQRFKVAAHREEGELTGSS